MNRILSFEGFVNEEVTPTSADTSLVGALAKRVYLDLKSRGYKVQMSYQNAKLGKQGLAKDLGEQSFKYDIKISYSVDFMIVLGDKLGEVADDLIEKYAGDDIEAQGPDKSNWGQLVFRLKEKSRSADSAMGRSQMAGDLSGMYRKANRSQRAKGLVGTSGGRALKERP